MTTNDPTIADFIRWLSDTQVPNEPINGGVLAVIWNDFVADVISA